MKSRSRLSIIYTYMIGLLGVLIIGCWALIAASQTIWRVDSNTTTIIDAHSVCIGYSAPNGKNVFIPARTASEYQSFRSNALISPNIVNCTYSWTTSAYGSCSLTCGGGTQSRTVQCKRHDGTVVAESYCGGIKPAVSQSCNTQACVIPVNGWWSAWSGFSACSASCGGGTQSQSRVCNNPAPANGWANCVGSTTQSLSCNTQACVPVITTGHWSNADGDYTYQSCDTRITSCNALTWCFPTVSRITPSEISIKNMECSSIGASISGYVRFCQWWSTSFALVCK